MKVLQIFKDLVKTSRPFSWINTGLPFLAGFLIYGGQPSAVMWVSLIYFFVFYNLLLYGINDVFDYRSDIRNPRKDSIEGGLMEKKNHKYLIYGIVLTNVPIIIYLLARLSSPSRIALLITVLLALSYSIRGLRFKEIPFLDSVNSSLHFVMPLVCGVIFAGATDLPWSVLISFLLWGMASHSLGAIQDINYDRAAKINSIAVFWGVRRTARFSYISYLLSSLIILMAYFPIGIIPAALLAIYTINVSFFLKIKSDAQAKQFRRAWRNFLWLNLVVGFWLSQYLLIIYDPFKLGTQIIAVISWFIIVASCVQLLILLHNFSSFRMPKTPRLDEWPRISILIHAYNQADNIASTLLAALGQNYPNFEIIFTDLGSDDNTKKIAEGYNDKKLKITTIDPPKAGWSINSWASNELLRHASGELSLILSADTLMMPNTLSTIASLMTAGKKKDLISFLPADQNKTLAQKLILSQNHALFLSAYPAAFLAKNFPHISSAYGGILAFNTEKITFIRGFELVKASPLEDMDLASHAQMRGLKTAFYLASNLATSQNHADLPLILKQNTQRYYPAMRFSFPLTVQIFLGGIFIFTGPLLFLIYATVTAQITLLPIIIFSLLSGYLVRLIVAIKSRQNIFAVIFYPLSNLVAMATLAASVAQYELFKLRWQKRTEL